MGRLMKVDPRKCWPHEANDFTPWLATAENIQILGDAIGMELEVESAEEAVGPFRADILCKDTATNNWVLVENQLERTDHSHLGQLLTYAAGLSCVTIVWIAHRFTDEHRAALDWLNDKTEEGINFFGLEIEVWRIADSPFAPKFNVVSKPNNWTKSLQPGHKAGLTPTQQMQIEYWTAFREFTDTGETTIKFSNPYHQNWIVGAIGKTGFILSGVASMWNGESDSWSGELRTQLELNDQYAKRYFSALIADRQAIEDELGESLVWYTKPDVRSCRIYLRKGADINNRTDWPNQHAWLLENLERFYRVFRLRVMKLNAVDIPEPVSSAI
jgi:hypothetical protein